MSIAGELEIAAIGGAVGGARYPQPVVLLWDNYSPLAQSVLSAGHTFQVDVDGKPHIRLLSYLDEDINFPERPKSSVFPNHNGARENTEGPRGARARDLERLGDGADKPNRGANRRAAKMEKLPLWAGG